MAEIIDIVCLQEMHLCAKDESYLKEVFQGHIWHAAVLARSKGVLIGVSKRIPRSLSRAINETSCFVILYGTLGQDN